MKERVSKLTLRLGEGKGERDLDRKREIERITQAIIDRKQIKGRETQTRRVSVNPIEVSVREKDWHSGK